MGEYIKINRKSVDERFFVASKEVFNDDRLSWEARGIMGYLMSKPHDWQVRNADLEKMGNAGRDKITRILSELKDYGYIRRYIIHDENGQFKTVTEIYPSPQDNADLQSNESATVYGKPVDGETASGSADDGDPGSLIINDDDQSMINHFSEHQTPTLITVEIERDLMEVGFTDKGASYLLYLAKKNFHDKQQAFLAVNGWIAFVKKNQAIHNPAGFIRSKIANSELPPITTRPKSAIPAEYEHLIRR